MSSLRVLLADDHAILRSGLRLLLGAQPDLEVVGEAADVKDTLCRACELRPDVLILDLTMPGGSGIHLIEQLRQRCPSVRVLILTMHDDLALVRAAPARAAADGSRLGLTGMSERAALLHGTVSVESAPGRGTRVTLCLPVTEEDHVQLAGAAGG